jgi:hypothetical protein
LPFFCFLGFLGQAAPRFARNADLFWLKFHNQHRKYRISDLAKCRTENLKSGLKPQKTAKIIKKHRFLWLFYDYL